jgi:hypothetical protein
LATLALDMMHADFDLVTGLLGRPDTVHLAGVDGSDARGSAATVVLAYPNAFARLSGSALMPQPYGMRGGWRATFTDGLLEYAMSAGFTGQGPAKNNPPAPSQAAIQSRPAVRSPGSTPPHRWNSSPRRPAQCR